jgi:hypothetical protein
VPVAMVDPRKALDTAHKFTKLPGSATACVVQLCPEQKSLIAANLVSLFVGAISRAHLLQNGRADESGPAQAELSHSAASVLCPCVDAVLASALLAIQWCAKRLVACSAFVWLPGGDALCWCAALGSRPLCGAPCALLL